MPSQVATPPVQESETTSSEKPSVHDSPIPKSADDSSTNVDKSSENAEKTGSDAEDPSNYVSGLKLVTLILALCLAVFLVALDQTIIATAIPKITDHFNSISDIGWYGSAYFLTSTSLQPSFGRVYKVFNVCSLQSIFNLASPLRY
jgi:hypothetical protein